MDGGSNERTAEPVLGLGELRCLTIGCHHSNFQLVVLFLVIGRRHFGDDAVRLVDCPVNRSENVKKKLQTNAFVSGEYKAK